MWGFGAKTWAKTKIWTKENRASSYCHHSICLQKTSILKKTVKIGWKMTKLCSKVASGLFCANWWLFWPNVLRYELQIYINFDRPKLAILSPKISKMAISVNMDFAHTHHGRFLIYSSKKNWILGSKSVSSKKQVWNFKNVMIWVW